MKFDSLDSNFACARFHQVPSNRILTKLTLRFHSRSLSVHCEFSRIVCVSLFSYQGSLSFDSSFIYHCHFRLSRTFLSFFKLFKWLFVIRRCISNSFTLSHPAKNVNKFFHFLLTFLKVSKRKIRFISKRIKLYHYAFSASSVFC